MLRFGAETTRLLEDAYNGSDFTERRLANLNALHVHAGDRVADIGCGPGMLTLELARAVGESGMVFGVDPSADMRESAARRCSGRSNIGILDGTATHLPLADASIGKAVAVQVFEYLDDIPAALKEAKRVLSPGGRLVIGDMHWDSLVWNSDFPDRMMQMIGAWDKHLSNRRVPALLPRMLVDAGFEVETIAPLAIFDATLRPDGLANMLIHLMQPYALQNGLVEEGQIQSWADEQRRLAASGRFFFSINHFVVVGRSL